MHGASTRLHPGAGGNSINTITTAASRTSFADVLATAINQSRLPLERIQAKLTERGTPVSVATLSYWQTGRSVPRRRSSLLAVANLESIVGLQPGELSGLLPHAPTINRDLAEGVPGSVRAERLLRSFGLPIQAPVRITRHIVERHFLADRREVTTVRCDVTMLGTIDRLPSVMVVDPARPRPKVSRVEGFVAGREHPDRGSGLVVGELLLPRPYGAGEEITVGAVLEWEPATAPRDEAEWAVLGPCQEFQFSVRFSGRVPRFASHFTRCSPTASTPPVFGERLDVTDGMVAVSVHDATPRIHGVRWSW